MTKYPVVMLASTLHKTHTFLSLILLNVCVYVWESIDAYNTPMNVKCQPKTWRNVKKREKRNLLWGMCGFFLFCEIWNNNKYYISTIKKTIINNKTWAMHTAAATATTSTVFQYMSFTKVPTSFTLWLSL